MNQSRRSSVSSQDSDGHRSGVRMSKRWTTLETAGRCMFLFSVAFFIVGVLITVFGFTNAGMEPAQQVPLQILGPTCLTMTIVMWVVGCIFSRLWNLEMKRQQHAIELRDRVQLHALAMDILNSPVISPTMLQDPRLRRQLLLKLRAQRALDLSSTESASRRSSRAPSVVSGRRISNSQYEKMVQHEMERRKSMKSEHGGDDKPPFELPGIQISRFETLDYGDGRSSVASGSIKAGSKRYIIIHSDLGSDFSRLSCPSDYSLAGSRSSKSRSSRASSGVSSRLWDFSPRESEWDADVSLGSRESQLSVLKQDWGGGPSDYNCRDSDCCMSPPPPRKLSVVTFDMGSPNVRRHSSPAYAMRRKDSGCECTCGSIVVPEGAYHKRYSDDLRIPSSLRKRSADHSYRSMSIRIDEDEPDILEESPLKEEDETAAVGGAAPPTNGSDNSNGSGGCNSRHCNSRKTSRIDDIEPAVDSNGGSSGCGATGGERRESREGGERRESRESRQLRPPLRRNNTDDSEVERRVARLFKEIEYSVTDSVDESKIQSCSSEHEYMYLGRKVEAKDMEVQTLTEDELRNLLEANNFNDVPDSRDGAKKGNLKDSRHNSAGSCSDNLRESFDSTDGRLADKLQRKQKKSRLAALSSALATLGGFRSSHSGEKHHKNIPQRLLLQGLSDDKDIEAGIKSPFLKSPPPVHQDSLNRNIPRR